jgi:hypothetical protein
VALPAHELDHLLLRSQDTAVGQPHRMSRYWYITPSSVFLKSIPSDQVIWYLQQRRRGIQKQEPSYLHTVSLLAQSWEITTFRRRLFTHFDQQHDSFCLFTIMSRLYMSDFVIEESDVNMVGGDQVNISFNFTFYVRIGCPRCLLNFGRLMIQYLYDCISYVFYRVLFYMRWYGTKDCPQIVQRWSEEAASIRGLSMRMKFERFHASDGSRG